MDQLVVLQEIYESFFKGENELQKISPGSIEGNCSELVRELLESSRNGRINEDLCLKLSECLQNVYEIKRLGDICRKAGLFGMAIQSYNRAISLNTDQSIRPVLLNNLGQAYARQGDLARAAIFYQKAANDFEYANDSGGLAHVLGNLGSAHRGRKDWDKAIEHYYISLKTFENSGDDLGIAQVTGSLGRTYAEMGEIDLAIRYFEKSLKDFQRLGDKKSVAWILDRLGRISCERKDWDKASSYYRQSLSLFDELGQRQGAGTVLCNLGKMYLDLGKTNDARESLERAIRLMPKSTQPAYQNALSLLAATYSTLAKDYLQEAEIFQPGKVKSDQKSEALASQYYSRASDRYLELSAMPKADLPEIKAATGITRSFSYLAKLQANVSDEEAMALAEKAATSLVGAAANSEEQNRVRIETLQKTLRAMKEIWSVGLRVSEPWKLKNAIANATESLLGVACSTNEANSFLCDALLNLREAIDEEKQRRDPTEQLKAAASNLRKAERRFKVSEISTVRQNALRIGEAAQIIEGLVGIETAPQKSSSPYRITDLLNYRAQRRALLLIGWVLLKNAKSELDYTTISYNWDDSFNLVDSHDEARVAEAIEIERVDTEPVLDLSEKRWLLPMKASVRGSPSDQNPYSPEKPPIRTVEIVKPLVQEVKLENTYEIIGDHYRNEEPREVKPSAEFAVESEAAETLRSTPGPSIEKIPEESPFRSNAIKLVEALIIVVFLLFAIDTTLYLI